MAHGNSSPRSGADRTFKEIGQATHSKPMMVEHIDYGIITEVDYNTYQVQIRLFGDSDNVVLGKKFWPLMTQREEIFQRFGQLEKGMYVRVHWRGRQRARFVVAELIGDSSVEFLKQQDMENELLTGPFKLFSGGLIPT